MSVELSYDLLSRFEVFDPKSDGLCALYRSAVENLPFTMVEYLTIRDIIQLSGHEDLPFHLLLLCMFLIRDAGSICLIFAEEQIREILGSCHCYDTSMEVHIRKLFENPLEEQYPDAVLRVVAGPDRDKGAGKSLNSVSPLIIRKENNREYLYFLKYYHYEQELETQLQFMLRKKEHRYNSNDTDAIKKIFTFVTEESPLIMSPGQNIVLNKQQRLAVVLSMIKDFVIISGGPGTGKTSIIATILRALIRLKGQDGTALYPPESIRLAAPTGRAARRITDSMRNALSSLDSADVELGQALESGVLRGETIHRLLRYSPRKNSFTYNEQYHLPAKVVIVDEVSMIDVLLMSHLTGALAPDVKLILLGDKNQLPSVDAGAVLADLIPNEINARYSPELAAYLEKDFSLKIESDSKKDLLSDRIVILNENYRSTSDLIDIADSINQMDLNNSKIDFTGLISTIKELPKETGMINTPHDGREREGTLVTWPSHRMPDSKEETYSAGGCRLLVPAQLPGDGRKQYKEWYDVYESWIYHHLCAGTLYGDSYLDTVLKTRHLDAEEKVSEKGKTLLSVLFRYLDESRILTILRNGPFGSSGINGQIKNNLSYIFDPDSAGEYFAGAPIIITRNDYGKELFNGDVGIVLRLSDDSYYAFFKTFGQYRFFPIYMLPDFELAFAITVHKAQGSEYNRILLVLPPEKNQRLLTREIIYTGLTRARDLAVIYAGREVLSTALERKIVRFSGISLWSRI